MIKKFILLALLILGISQFCHYQTKGFTIHKITTHEPFQQVWKTSELSPAIAQILDQKFHFLAAGGSCYAFESDDGKYVLKFFKFHHLNQTKLNRVFSSIQYGFDTLHDETGLLYLHLNPTQSQLKPLTIVDPIGIAHTIQLDPTSFFLQKKAELAYDYIAHQTPDEARQSYQQILELIQTIHNRGFDDVDPNIETNFGFIDGKAIKLDVGPFIPYTAESQFPNAKHLKALRNFDNWMSQHNLSHD